MVIRLLLVVDQLMSKLDACLLGLVLGPPAIVVVSSDWQALDMNFSHIPIRPLEEEDFEVDPVVAIFKLGFKRSKHGFSPSATEHCQPLRHVFLPRLPTPPYQLLQLHLQSVRRLPKEFQGRAI
ncbi:hypothetical protein METHP14_820014 [Pseudomonas sp. P14-2025]